MDAYGNLMACNTEAKDVAGFCCHLDTVHKKAPEPELILGNILTSFNGGGIGGDDKCGIVACLEMLNSRIPCRCFFFRDEEIGCVGSKEFDVKNLEGLKFLIEIDRKGGNDLIFNSGGEVLCDDEFKEEVKRFFPHGKEAQGLLTDVNKLGDAKINMMNLSAGYYNPHKTNEYVVLSELFLNIKCLKEFAASYGAGRVFERPATKYWSGNYGNKTNNTTTYQESLYGSEYDGYGEYPGYEYDGYGGYKPYYGYDAAENAAADNASEQELAEWLELCKQEAAQAKTQVESASAGPDVEVVGGGNKAVQTS